MNPHPLPTLGITLILAAACLTGGCGRPRAERPVVRQDSFRQDRGVERELRVDARVSSGRLSLDRSDPGALYNLDLRWDAANMSRRVDFTPGDTARLEFSLQGEMPSDDTAHAILSLAPNVPLDLKVDTGAGEARLDLTGLSVVRLNIVHGVGSLKVAVDDPQEAACRSMDIACGVGEMDLRGLGNLMPETINIKGGLGRASLCFDGSRPGRTRARLVVGIGNLDIELPAGLGVRVLDSGDASGSLGIPEEHFERRAGAYVTPAYREARQIVELSLKPGLGNATITIRD